MHIGYDITVLYCANGGILRYTVSLLAALRDLIRRGEIDADLTLVDYAPARGDPGPCAPTWPCFSTNGCAWPPLTDRSRTPSARRHG
jgi:hypothetical protein